MREKDVPIAFRGEVPPGRAYPLGGGGIIVLQYLIPLVQATDRQAMISFAATESKPFVVITAGQHHDGIIYKKKVS
jgi:hypothetical protein